VPGVSTSDEPNLAAENGATVSRKGIKRVFDLFTPPSELAVAGCECWWCRGCLHVDEI